MLSIAILDDYQGISEPIFKTLDSVTHQVTVFKDTLRPYNHPDTTQEEKEKLVNRLEPFTVICTMRERTPFPADLIARLPNLKLLLTTGVRNASLDLFALKAKGITVAGTRHNHRQAQLGADSTTTQCVGLILAAARGIVSDDAALKANGNIWQTTSAASLTDKTFGTLGLGRLGTNVARIMHLVFGMRVIAWSANLTQDKADQQAKAADLPAELANGEKTFKVVSKEELLSTSDVLSLHLVLSERSRGIIAAPELALLKPTAIFINTSRGPLVVEKDLLETLERGKIRSAAIDVFDLEPLPADSKWRTTKWGAEGRSQVVLTPHMGYVEGETLVEWYEAQVKNIKRWQNGEPLDLVLA